MEKILLYPLNKISVNTIKNRKLLDEECIGILDFNGSDNKMFINSSESLIYSEYKTLKFTKLYIYDNLIGDIHIREIYEKNKVKEKVIDLIKYCNKKNIEVIIAIYSNELAEIIKENKLNVSYVITDEVEYQELQKFTKYKNQSLNIGVFATDSCAGKFTTQMLLKDELEKIGKVEVILTEPNGFQISKYNAPVNDYFSYTEFIDYCKLLKKKIYYEENNDFTIFSGQSGISFKYTNSPVYFELQSLSLLYLLSSESDIIYLVYKPFDITNLRKSIKIIKAFCNVIQIVIVIPNQYEKNHLEDKELNRYIKISYEEFLEIKKNIESQIGDYPVVSINELSKSLNYVEKARQLKPILKDGKIKSYSKKNKELILWYIIQKFDYSKIYNEKTVNKIIIDSISFDDYALIRRELIENKQLHRNENGTNYKRI